VGQTRTLALAVVLALAGSATAQEDGTIAGTVSDHSGAALPGAKVTATQTSTQVAQSATTDEDGRYSLRVAPGTYDVKAELDGFKTAEIHGVVVRAGKTRALDLRLEVGDLEETVAVTAAVLAPTAFLARSASAPPMTADFNTEAYDRIDEIGFRDPRKHPLSTFSVDVDTASYANVRRFLDDGQLPPKDAVRIEEMVNYFDYDYPAPEDDTPFSITTEVGACPWTSGHKLALIGLATRPLGVAERPPLNLVFLLDVSGSMDEPRKLPLLKRAMKLLVNRLDERDQVAVVVYAGASGLALPRTTGREKQAILDALERLRAGGSTHGSAGIQLAYQIAQEGATAESVNRVILATDGDFNVGVTDMGALTRLIEEKRETGVFLSVLGFGTGNLKDSTMEALADRGNGNYAYIDSLHEARKVLVSEAGATLVTIAKDVKIQVELNPQQVGAYRLLGYENRMLRDEDFNDDTKDAGEIGAGHRVTALYEIVPPGQEADVGGVAPLRYQESGGLKAAARSDELMTVSLRFKRPGSDESEKVSVVVEDASPALDEASANLGFAAAVAELGLLLRDSEFKGNASYDRVLGAARRHRGADPHNYRGELIKLVEMARELANAEPGGVQIRRE
jgi:Ca-activated chloride channel family protein